VNKEPLTFVTYEWVKMNPTEAAERIEQLQYDNGLLRAALEYIERYSSTHSAEVAQAALASSRKEIE
jgi:hypothetical protein